MHFVGGYSKENSGILLKSTMGLVIGHWLQSAQPQKLSKHLDLFIYEHHCTSAEESLKMAPSLKSQIVKALI